VTEGAEEIEDAGPVLHELPPRCQDHDTTERCENQAAGFSILAAAARGELAMAEPARRRGKLAMADGRQARDPKTQGRPKP
jgi:hypothetical protein